MPRQSRAGNRRPVLFDTGTCRGCGLCVGVCPKGAVEEIPS
ncbi:4Fe-4S binding protein [Candidatus Hakubella thermalkaliphila]